MARRTISRRQQPGSQTMRRMPAHAAVEPQPQPLVLPLLLPPQSPAVGRDSAAKEEALPGSIVIVIDLN